MDASALASQLDSLEKSWSSLDCRLNFWTAMVVVGVAVELAVLLMEYRHEWKDFKRGVIHSPEKPTIIASIAQSILNLIIRYRPRAIRSLMGDQHACAGRVG